MYELDYASPVGNLRLVSDGGFLTRLERAEPQNRRDDCDLLRRAAQELDEYFAGTRRSFDLPLKPEGTPFQLAAWEALCRIPYGETRSYAQQAASIGRPGAARAIGQANHRNPISIFIPCHRVIGASGRLTGYGGGLDMKAFLLALEQRGGAASDFISQGVAMKKNLTLPQLKPEMKAGVLCAWLKAPGEALSAGDALFELETEKVVHEIEADCDGVMGAQLVEEGDTVPVGAVLAEVER